MPRLAGRSLKKTRARPPNTNMEGDYPVAIRAFICLEHPLDQQLGCPLWPRAQDEAVGVATCYFVSYLRSNLM